MVRRIWSTAALAALPFVLAGANPAHAADEDTQLWVFANTVVPLGKATSTTMELSPRFRRGGDQFLMRGTVDYRLNEVVSVGGGGAYVEFSGGHELRAHQQLTLTMGPLALRTRVEERFFEGADRAQIRFRQRVQSAWPLAPGTRLSGSAELLYIGRTEGPLAKARVDSWRGNLAIQGRIAPHLDAALGYLVIYSPRTGVRDRVSHVPQVTLTLRP